MERPTRGNHIWSAVSRKGALQPMRPHHTIILCGYNEIAPIAANKPTPAKGIH